jgi:hypothetical protein
MKPVRQTEGPTDEQSYVDGDYGHTILNALFLQWEQEGRFRHLPDFTRAFGNPLDKWRDTGPVVQAGITLLQGVVAVAYARLADDDGASLDDMVWELLSAAQFKYNELQCLAYIFGHVHDSLVRWEG